MDKETREQFEKINERFDNLEERFDNLEDRVNRCHLRAPEGLKLGFTTFLEV